MKLLKTKDLLEERMSFCKTVINSDVIMDKRSFMDVLSICEAGLYYIGELEKHEYRRYSKDEMINYLKREVNELIQDMLNLAIDQKRLLESQLDLQLQDNQLDNSIDTGKMINKITKTVDDLNNCLMEITGISYI